MSASSNKKLDTFWLAYIKNEIPVFGKITLGELVKGSTCLRIITDVNLVTGESVNIYWPNARTSSDGNPAIYIHKQDAVGSLLGQIDTTISEYNSRISKLHQARSLLRGEKI